MTSNIIKKEIVIDAPRHRVWSALTEGQHIGIWFGNGQPTRIDPCVGGIIVFDHGGHGDIPARIEAFTPMSVLTYRWAVIGPAGTQPLPSNSTVVSFLLDEQGSSTVVGLTETGFQSVDAAPAELEARYRANDQGWSRTLNALADYIRTMPNISLQDS